MPDRPQDASDLPPLTKHERQKHPTPDLFFTAGPGPLGCVTLVLFLVLCAGGAGGFVLWGLTTLAANTGIAWIGEQPVTPLATIAAMTAGVLLVWWPLSQRMFGLFKALRWIGTAEFRDGLLVVTAYNAKWTGSIDPAKPFELDPIQPPASAEGEGLGQAQLGLLLGQDSELIELWCYPGAGSPTHAVNAGLFADKAVSAGYAGALQFDDALLARIQLRLLHEAAQHGITPGRTLSATD